jgi:hypothetical protein
MKLILTDPDMETLVDGMNTLDPEAAFTMFGLVNIHQCLAPPSGIDKAMINFISFGLYLSSYLAIFAIGFLWLRSVERQGSTTIVKIHNKLPTFMRDKKLSDFKIAGKSYPLITLGLELLLLILEPLFQSIVGVFDCKKASIEGQERLFLNGHGDAECWRGSHIGLAIFSAVLGIVLFIAIPLYVHYLIAHRFEKGHVSGFGISLVFYRLFYFQTEPFREKYPYWMLGKALVDLTIQLFSMNE